MPLVVGRLNRDNFLAGRGDIDPAKDDDVREARMGIADATFNLGDLALSASEFGSAEYWFRRSAELGDAEAVDRLVELLESRQALVEAPKWRRRSHPQQISLYRRSYVPAIRVLNCRKCD
jgi:hypothetical protein